ncbi:MAG: preprotein translocase subunit SecG [Angelakisella sp.]|jgi:preprotein translocase subunit SecG|nr:preprotein translocase subunit SecG [Angelakisella sp.]
MGAIEIVGAILMIAVSILVTVIIMFQNPKGDGLSSLAGGSSFMSGVKDRSVDAKLNRLIKVLAVAFFVVTIAVYAFGIYL